MDDILSQIIAYAPDKIDTELKAAALVQGSRNMDQEPRMQFNNGLSVDPERDSFKKISNVLGAYRRYRRGEKNPALNFNQFFELYSTENFASGGSAGQLVQPSDGSRLQYDGSKESQVINAYKILKNKLNRNPTRIEMVDAGFDATTVDKWTQKNNLKLIKAQYTQEFQDKRIKGLQKSLKTKKYDKLVVHDGKIKGPNSLVKAYLKDLKKRFKYPHDSKKYKQALEAGKVLSNSQLMEKYNLSLNSIERLNSVLTKSNKLKYPKQTYEGSLKIIKDQADKRETAIKERDGSVKFKKGTKEFPKGHAGNIYGNNLIKPGEIIYTPQKVNAAMSGGVDPKDPKNRYSALDYKIKATEEDIDRIKKSKMSPNQKRIELQKLDNKLVEYVGKSDGYKIATLSDGSKYGDVFRKAQSMDPMDIFPDKTEKEVIEFLKKYKNKKVKVNAAGEIITPQSEIDNIQKAVMFDENSKLALNNAKKIKVEKDMLEFAGTITDQCSIGNADGGRIGFKTAGKVDCLKIAKEGMENGLKNGFKQGQGDLARKILGSGKFLKEAVSLRGLFGPAALAFTVLTEAGFVGYDMLSEGKSFREAVGDSVFNYMLGDKTKIDSDKEFIKRLKNIPGSPSQGFRGVTDEDIGKMQYFNSIMGDIQTGSKNYNTILDLEEKIRDNTLNQQVPEFSDQAFQLNTQLDKAQAENQDYFRLNKPGEIEKYTTTKKDGTMPFMQGAEAVLKASLLEAEDRYKDINPSSLKGLEALKKKKIDNAYDLYRMNNPTKITGYEDATPSEMSYVMSKIKNEPDNNYGLFGPAELMEGGIASLNVKK